MVKAPRQSSPSESLSDDRVADAALAVIGEHGWRETSLGAVAGRLGVPVARVVAVAPSRSALLSLVFRTIDRRMLADVTAADELEPRRDRLFDLIMRRLDVLSPHKRGVESLARDALRDSATAVTMLAELRRSQALTLEAAGFSTRGLWGELRVQGLGALYASVLRTWRDDDTPDLAHTMKALDKALDQAARAEHFACALVPSFGRGRGRRGERDGGDAGKTSTSGTPGNPGADNPMGRGPSGPEPA